MSTDPYYEPEYCDYCGGPHNSAVCRDLDEGPDDEDPDEVFCGKCGEDIPIGQCVEVLPGMLSHEAASGAIHVL